MKIFETYTNLLEIRAKEAYTDKTSIQTLIDRKRDVGFVGLEYPSSLKMVDDNGIKRLRVPSNKYNTYVIYLPGAEQKAQELLAIAEKYKGFLSPNASDEEIVRIGQILQYDEADVQDYINRIRAKKTLQ